MAVDYILFAWLQDENRECRIYTNATTRIAATMMSSHAS